MEQSTIDLIATLLPIVLPMLGIGGFSGYKMNKQRNSNEEKTRENSLIMYKYDVMVSFVKTIANCLEDGKITPEEAKIIARQLKGVLGDSSEVDVNTRKYAKGGLLDNV